MILHTPTPIPTIIGIQTKMALSNMTQNMAYESNSLNTHQKSTSSCIHVCVYIYTNTYYTHISDHIEFLDSSKGSIGWMSRCPTRMATVEKRYLPPDGKTQKVYMTTRAARVVMMISCFRFSCIAGREGRDLDAREAMIPEESG